MLSRLLVLVALSLVCLATRAEQGGWQASVELQPIGDSVSTLPEVLVPKQSVLLKVVVWMPGAVNWYPRYPQWDMPGATLLPLMMLSPLVEREQDGFTQRGATQNYLVTPLAEGELRLSPRTIKVYPNQEDSPVLPLDPVNLQVALPDGAESIDSFLPATKLTATQRFFLLTNDGQPKEIASDKLSRMELRSGQMLERRITVEALGVQGGQIPPLQIDDEAIQREVDTTDLNNYGDFSGGKRVEHWYYAPGSKALIKLQPVTVRWYDLGSRAFRNATLIGGEILAVVVQEVDARLQLSWRERLMQTSPWMLMVLLLGLAVVMSAACFGRSIVRSAAARLHGWCKSIEACEPYLFLLACYRVGLWGMANQLAYHAFQRWLVKSGASIQLDKSTVLQAWCRSRYSTHQVCTPRRLRLIRALFALRSTLAERKVDQGRFDLPALHRLSIEDAPKPVVAKS
ncbi:hypothetical protein ACLUTX_29430 [Enterobacterales bacterium AE_CKDN230030158-1A_HGKHYDSX7]